MSKPVVIRFEGPEEWEQQWENVNSILDKHTGTSEYLSTKSVPPTIFGAELTPEGIDELKAQDGVIVDIPDEE
ncbi:uncharacterized protein N7506_004502 [Penicillium brevicompactum]|uniref:uncharacterized protein n=1 Tax=Penicillium brevicompactum TaxID=5074 RepID=UPI002540EDE0|nr:uncharacterized protein N7506_004502 [Penicillium brevicompactum]KAJ5336480.1 hypothetical protein N7506_004502 [Penicillium brevicompactum]